MSTRVRHVNKSLFKNYLRKSEECLDAASECLKNARWNAAVINAVHCGISASDALTVFMLGVRHAGERHEDVISLIQTTGLPKDILTARSKQLSRLLGIKNAAEYLSKCAQSALYESFQSCICNLRRIKKEKTS